MPMRTKTLLLALALLSSAALCTAATYPFGVTAGGPTISPASTTPSLQPGDTLLVSGTYYQLNFKGLKGTAAKRIYVVCLPGSLVTSTAGWTAGEWSGCEYVTVSGLTSRNNQAPVVWFRSACHDVTFDGCSFTNDRGKYSTQQAFLFDDKNSTAMNFNGTKATTFYNVGIFNCVLSGFQGVNAIDCGSDGARSVCTDFVVEHNVFKNITTYGPIVPGAIGGTLFNFQCHYNRFDSLIVDAGAYQGVHGGCITGHGNGDIAYNRFSSMYMNPVRWGPLRWTGLPGYAGDLAIHDNLVYDLKSFDAFEVNLNQSSSRIKALNLDTAATDVYLNTVYRTTRSSYNGDWHGYVVGLLAHKVRVRYNVIVDPEHGTAYDPKARLGYAVAFIAGDQPGFDSVGNRCFPTAAAAGVDTTTWQLAATSPLLDLVPVNPSKTDLFGTPRPQGRATDLGAVERVTGVPPDRHIATVQLTVVQGYQVVTITWTDGSVTVEY